MSMAALSAVFARMGDAATCKRLPVEDMSTFKYAMADARSSAM
jgi:hypothetical protein